MFMRHRLYGEDHETRVFCQEYCVIKQTEETRLLTFCRQKRAPIDGRSQVVILKKPVNTVMKSKIDTS